MVDPGRDRDHVGGPVPLLPGLDPRSIGGSHHPDGVERAEGSALPPGIVEHEDHLPGEHDETVLLVLVDVPSVHVPLLPRKGERGVAHGEVVSLDRLVVLAKGLDQEPPRIVMDVPLEGHHSVDRNLRRLNGDEERHAAIGKMEGA